ncbi:PLP-dependent aminotransferase family protein [Corynebacterium pacaense]|uniref:MocR-like pyridoxine biosynthesis transcription factor PdxR n=1 Tax=Corynebacterium pacaense TaxID=1816684 RepID=UPI0009BC116D|nr:PLP-dependent aminotransferase family protein [Corynebacterium pacaense]
MRPDLVADLPLDIDPHSKLSIPVQLAAQIRELLTRRVIAPGDHLPSTRMLAARLGVSRGTVVTAYEQLGAEGYLTSAHGSGTLINPGLNLLKPDSAGYGTEKRTPQAPVQQDLINLDPGIPDTTTLADSAWRAAWRRACSTPPRPQPPLGLPALRVEISEHLRHMRGLVADPSRIVVTAGAREGLTLLLRALGDNLDIGVESPGYPSLRRVPQVLGHRTVNLNTDADGLDVDRLGAPLDAVLLTPSHQYPYGGSLPASRRTRLTTWAADNSTLLIEDDFDSELRYLGMPLPALTAMAPERAVLLGTFSSVISPQIACGYLVAPEELIPELGNLRGIIGQPVGAITQEALAHYLASGALRRRTQRMRRLYRRRRELVTRTFSTTGNAELRPINGGLHAVLICNLPESEVVRNCADRGVGVTGLSSYWGGGKAENGIVFGFGGHDDATLERALRRIVEATAP